MTNTHTPTTTPSPTPRVDTTALSPGGTRGGEVEQQFEAEAFEEFEEVGSQAAEVVIPEEMRQQAVRTEAALAAGTLPPARPDDLTELAERITQLRERVTARTDPAGAPAGSADDARREQLSRWHQDESTAEQGCAVETGDSDVAGWSG